MAIRRMLGRYATSIAIDKTAFFLVFHYFFSG